MKDRQKTGKVFRMKDVSTRGSVVFGVAGKKMGEQSGRRAASISERKQQAKKRPPVYCCSSRDEKQKERAFGCGSRARARLSVCLSDMVVQL